MNTNNSVEFWQTHHRYQCFPGWCGSACIQMALSACGIQKAQWMIARDVHKSWWGVSQQLMLAYFSRYFKTVNYKINSGIRDISFHLNQGHVVIVNFWDNFSDKDNGEGHYAVVAECRKGTITLVDPSKEREGIWFVSTKDFNPHWYDTVELHHKIYVEGWMLWIEPRSKIERI